MKREMWFAMASRSSSNAKCPVSSKFTSIVFKSGSKALAPSTLKNGSCLPKQLALAVDADESIPAILDNVLDSCGSHRTVQAEQQRFRVALENIGQYSSCQG